LAGGSAVGVGLLLAAAFADGWLQGGLWVLALSLDLAEPYFFGAEGWKLVPHHFAERHGLIIIIALGESIVAIGVGAEAGVDSGVVVVAALGIVVASALWWLYFDVVALLSERSLADLQGRELNERARDAYSYLHFPMVAGIVLLALGLKKTISDVGDPLDLVIAAAMLGGAALYLLGHVAFRYRNVRSVNNHRLLCALAVLVALPVAVEVPAGVTLAFLAAALTILIALEAVRFAGSRERVRRELAGAEE
jgi:low temperature requirement protein LtrA